MAQNAVRNLQQRLQAWGFDIGPTGVDGVLGPKTKAALEAAQKRLGLPVTGTATADTSAALATPPPPMQAPRPNMRPPPDQLNDTQRPNTGLPPIPQMRNVANVPPPDQLGTGNTNVMPRLRPDEQPRKGYGTSPMPQPNFRPTTQKVANNGVPEAWLPPGMIGGARRNSMDVAAGYEPGHRPQMGLDQSQLPVAQSIMASLGPKAWQPGYWKEARFAAGLPPTGTDASPPPQVAAAQPQSLGAMSAAANGVLSGNQPSPDAAPDPAALDQVKAMLWQMMAGARIQPQPGQPAKQDLYSTATQPPRLPLRY